MLQPLYGWETLRSDGVCCEFEKVGQSMSKILLLRQPQVFEEETWQASHKVSVRSNPVSFDGGGSDGCWMVQMGESCGGSRSVVTL